MWNEPIKIKRDDLYKMVWKEPISKIALEYGISDRGLAKICAKLKIPVPRRGYWQKIRSGLKVTRPILKPLDHHKVAYIYSRGPKEKQMDSAITQILLAEKRPENKIVVSPEHMNHPLILRTVESLRKAKPNSSGLIQPKRSGCLNINVSPESLERSISIMAMVVNALEARGLTLFKAPSSNVIDRVRVIEEVFEIGIEEQIEAVERKLTVFQKKQKKEHPLLFRLPEYDYFPTGNLTLKIKNKKLYKTRKSWSDGKKHRLEDLLNSFIRGLYKAAESIRVERLESERRELERERQRQERLERERLRLEEENRIKRLDDEISAWNKSRLIRSYINALKKAIFEANGEIQVDGDIEKWILWAKDYANRIDPMQKY